MERLLKLGDLTIDVVRKDIANVHLSVHPPTGRVRLAVPEHVSDNAVRAFAIGKLDWIRRRQSRLRDQERETPREYIDRESHHVWGRRCLLRVIEQNVSPTVEWHAQHLILTVRPGTSPDRRADILERWYRKQVRVVAAELIPSWEASMGVSMKQLYVQRMRTRWGSCNQRSASIRLNTDLAKKPRTSLEYVLVHELAHLIEPTHNARFVSLMDSFLPGWEHRRLELNRLPVRHADWTY